VLGGRWQIGSEAWDSVEIVSDPEHQRWLVVPAVRGAKKPHLELLADPDRAAIVQVCDGPDLLESEAESIAQQRLSRFGCQAAPPAIWMEVPSDLDLAVTVGERLEENGSGGDASRKLQDRPPPVSRVDGKLIEHPFDQRAGFSGVCHRATTDPPRNFHAAMHVIETLRLIDSPWPQHETIGFGDDAGLGHTGDLMKRAVPSPKVGRRSHSPLDQAQPHNPFGDRPSVERCQRSTSSPRKNPPIWRAFLRAAEGTRTLDLLHGKRLSEL
jgi:hypothetical protein